MRFIWCKFVLLVIVEYSLTAASLSDIIVNTAGRISGTRNDDCSNNYKHNNDLKPSGYLYTLYASSKFASNEVAMYIEEEDDMVYARITSDGKCCSTANYTLGEENNTFTIASDADCLPENLVDSGEQKIMFSNTDSDSSCCFIVWICRKARKGVYAVCVERMISEEQTEWIHRQYDQMGLKPLKVEQSVDYSEGKCFKN